MKAKRVKLKSEPKSKSKSADKPSEVNYVLWLAAIVVVTFILFMPALSNEFTSWDDQEYIVKNSFIKSLSFKNISYIFSNPIANNYHPFTILSLALNFSISGLEPGSYYLVNILFHLINLILVFIFIKKLGGNTNAALFSALIFAVHPMHVESVAWASERKDVLYTFFFLAGLITYLNFLKSKNNLYYVLTFMMALSSMFSKPAAIIFPLVLIAVDFYKSGRIELKSAINKIPFFIMGAIFMYLTWVAQQDNNALVADFKTYNYFERILFVCFDLIIYAIKFFIPFKLAAFHPYPEPISWYYYLTPVIIAAVCFYIFKSNQRRHLLIFGALFYFINLILVLQFVSIGNALFAERYTYMPYNGLLFVAGTMLFSDSMKSKQVWAVILTIATVFSVITFQRVKTWKNSETLWTDQIEKYPDNPHGYYDRGTYYSETGQYEKAIVDLDKAVSLKQEYKHFLNRGVAYLKLKNYEKAFDNFSDAYKLDSFKNEASAGLAQYYNAKGMNEEAIYYINRSLSQKNTYEGLFTKAAILKGLRRYDDAVLTYNEAIAMNDNPSARFNLANIYFSNLNDFNKAVSAYDAVLNLDPNYPNAAAYKGFALYKANRFSEAITAFNQALQSDAKNAQVLGYLSMAYQMNGDISKARQQAATAESAGFVFDQEFMNKIK